MSLYEDVSNNRAGTGWNIGGAIIGFISIIAMAVLAQPFGLIIGIVGLAIGGICSIIAMKKNNEQTKELQNAILNTNKRVGRIEPVVQGKTANIQKDIVGNSKEQQESTLPIDKQRQMHNNREMLNLNNLSTTKETKI